MEVGDAYFEIFVETRIVEMKIKTKDALEEQINCDVLESIWHSCHFGSRCVSPVRFQTPPSLVPLRFEILQIDTSWVGGVVSDTMPVSVAVNGISH